MQRKFTVAVAIGLSVGPFAAATPAQACQMSLAQEAAIPGAPDRLSRSDKNKAREVIRPLQYSEIWRNKAQTLYKNDRMRLDVQAGTGGSANLQVQTNGKKSKSVAAVLVAETLGNVHDSANQKGVVRKTIGALYNSLDTGKIYRVNGSCR